MMRNRSHPLVPKTWIKKVISREYTWNRRLTSNGIIGCKEFLHFLQKNSCPDIEKVTDSPWPKKLVKSKSNFHTSKIVIPGMPSEDSLNSCSMVQVDNVAKQILQVSGTVKGSSMSSSSSIGLSNNNITKPLKMDLQRVNENSQCTYLSSFSHTVQSNCSPNKPLKNVTQVRKKNTMISPTTPQSNPSSNTTPESIKRSLLVSRTALAPVTRLPLCRSSFSEKQTTGIKDYVSQNKKDGENFTVIKVKGDALASNCTQEKVKKFVFPHQNQKDLVPITRRDKDFRYNSKEKKNNFVSKLPKPKQCSLKDKDRMFYDPAIASKKSSDSFLCRDSSIGNEIPCTADSNLQPSKEDENALVPFLTEGEVFTYDLPEELKITHYAHKKRDALKSYSKSKLLTLRKQEETRICVPDQINRQPKYFSCSDREEIADESRTQQIEDPMAIDKNKWNKALVPFLPDDEIYTHESPIESSMWSYYPNIESSFDSAMTSSDFNQLTSCEPILSFQEVFECIKMRNARKRATVYEYSSDSDSNISGVSIVSKLNNISTQRSNIPKASTNFSSPKSDLSHEKRIDSTLEKPRKSEEVGGLDSTQKPTRTIPVMYSNTSKRSGTAIPKASTSRVPITRNTKVPKFCYLPT